MLASPLSSACTTSDTAATLWLAAGESIYFVQQQLGHADIQTTIDQYGHPDEQAHREAAARAAAWWREGREPSAARGSVAEFGQDRALRRPPAGIGDGDRHLDGSHTRSFQRA